MVIRKLQDAISKTLKFPCLTNYSVPKKSYALETQRNEKASFNFNLTSFDVKMFQMTRFLGHTTNVIIFNNDNIKNNEGSTC